LVKTGTRLTTNLYSSINTQRQAPGFRKRLLKTGVQGRSSRLDGVGVPDYLNFESFSETRLGPWSTWD